MKRRITFLIWLLTSTVGLSQRIEKSTNVTTVSKLKENITRFYVNPKVGGNINARLDKELKNNTFKNLYKKEFSKKLTNILREYDWHFTVRNRPSRRPLSSRASKQIQNDRLLQNIFNREEAKQRNHGGFIETKIIKNNIGYLKLHHFDSNEEAKPMIDKAMALLEGARAIIIDLRENGGGNPGAVQYLCSYFFNKRIHLNSIYDKGKKLHKEFWTLPIEGIHRSLVPLYILTSYETFSGAEEFSYNMKYLNRATLIGETTRGGANPTRGFIIDGFDVRIPFRESINPITKTNWERKGVTPHIKVDAKKALEKAIELSKESSVEYWKTKQIEWRKQYAELQQSINKARLLIKRGNEEGAKQVVEIELLKGVKTGMLNNWSINELGYSFAEKDKPIAQTIFVFNINKYPKDPNVFDSYGEFLEKQGKFNKAKQYYNKAVTIAKAQAHRRLRLYKDNLSRVTSK